MGRRIDALRRRVLDPDVLRRLMPLRRPTAIFRSGERDAREREQSFIARCDPFARGKRSGGHRVIDGGRSSKHETIEIEALTLDSRARRPGLDLREVSFAKVDTQGSELHVLRGASEVLACRHIAWQIEIVGRSARAPRLRAIGDLGRLRVGSAEARTDILAFSLHDGAVRQS